MIPVRALLHSQIFPSSSSVARPSSVTPTPPVPNLHGTFSVTLGEETGLPPQARTFIVPRPKDTNLTDVQISSVLNDLRQNPKHFTFNSSSDKKGGHQIQCTSGGEDESPSRSVVTLHIDCGKRLRELTVEKSQEDGQKTKHFARFEQSPPPATALRTRAPRWLAAPRAEGATDAAEGRLFSIPESSAAEQQEWIGLEQDITAALKLFGMDWHTLDKDQQQDIVEAGLFLPPESLFAGMTKAAIRQEQLHRALSSIQTGQSMIWFSSLRQLTPQVIEPAMLVPCSLAPAAYYSTPTVDGPHRDRDGNQCFYLERQRRHGCAQHAVNAMVGGPLLSLQDFADWEADAAERNAAQGSLGPTHGKQIANTMWKQGVYPETVNETLQRLKIPTHFYVHNPIRPVTDSQESLGLDHKQACFLDGLDTDRLLLQADLKEGNSTTSHYVAFRKDAGRQWVLLDSLNNEPQPGISPSQYLLGAGAIHFTAIWPQNLLVSTLPEERRGADSAQDARNHESGQHEEQFGPLLAPPEEGFNVCLPLMDNMLDLVKKCVGQ